MRAIFSPALGNRAAKKLFLLLGEKSPNSIREVVKQSSLQELRRLNSSLGEGPVLMVSISSILGFMSRYNGQKQQVKKTFLLLRPTLYSLMILPQLSTNKL